jgi:hypothetical protein
MLQLALFDAKGKPTNTAQRYVTPRFYKVYNADGERLVRNPHTAIKMWLIHRDSKLAVVW